MLIGLRDGTVIQLQSCFIMLQRSPSLGLQLHWLCIRMAMDHCVNSAYLRHGHDRLTRQSGFVLTRVW